MGMFSPKCYIFKSWPKIIFDLHQLFLFKFGLVKVSVFNSEYPQSLISPISKFKNFKEETLP
jgi:hypothetical protein